MSHDEETEVRQRLRRLTEAAAAPPPWPEAPLVGVPPSSLVGAPPADVLPRSAALVAESGSDGLALPPEARLPGPGAFDPGRRGVRALAVVAVVVVVGAAGWAWQARPQSEPVAPLASETASAAPVGDPSVSGSGELVVAVAGKVRKPGLVRLPAGSRLADAVQAAGGALPGVDVALLNPARKVTDGELIVVGVTPPPVPGGAAGPAAGGAAPAAGPLNLNTATLAQLDTLPGVGPVLAQRILTHRDQHGGFKSVGDLRQVDGIGDARYEQLKDLVTV
ncbi:ComEA family DNA-binding protein [Micromonospora sp. MED01]|uniref:ComEA family DNA-binding protein n=1 Tax=Micromonospora alfalfae TaxID=2911212 RepID=UPI001EE8AE42|nr:ComEA family DNA-binding protein [Micromonospora alfalfae]MCG5464940.1 ComEA family DNA-binding protein [Micromonospora alfalfae]